MVVKLSKELGTYNWPAKQLNRLLAKCVGMLRKTWSAAVSVAAAVYPLCVPMEALFAASCIHC